MLTIEQFRTNFDPFPVPCLLEDLLMFESTSSREWYSRYFELSIVKREILKYHVPVKALSQFFGFGRNKDDSLYALWRYQEIPLDEAPVIYLNSEGEGSGVQASNLADFFMLLAFDQEPIFGVYSDPIGKDIKHTNRNTEFREWLEQRYHLHAAEYPNDVVLQARHRHPKVPLIGY